MACLGCRQVPEGKIALEQRDGLIHFSGRRTQLRFMPIKARNPLSQNFVTVCGDEIGARSFATLDITHDTPALPKRSIELLYGQAEILARLIRTAFLI